MEFTKEEIKEVIKFLKDQINEKDRLIAVLKVDYNHYKELHKHLNNILSLIETESYSTDKHLLESLKLYMFDKNVMKDIKYEK